MPCTEAYKEHIMYTFNGFCKTVIRYTALNAWRDRSRRRQKEISLEYLTEEKFYPLGTTDEYFEASYEEYPITICGQTVILTNGEFAAALLSAGVQPDIRSAELYNSCANIPDDETLDIRIVIPRPHMVQAVSVCGYAELSAIQTCVNTVHTIYFTSLN